MRSNRRASVSLAALVAALACCGALASSSFAALHTTGPAPHAAPASVGAFDTTATIDGTAWFAGMYARGFRLYVMHATAWGTCTPWAKTQAQLRAALSVGLKIAIYTRDPRCFTGGIAAAGPLVPKLQFFALDAETDPGVAITRAMVAGVRALGVRPVIYTGSGMWARVQGSQDASFADVPLWDTNVDMSGASGAALPAQLSYGGWNTAANPRALVQRAFEVNVDGVQVNIDSVDSSFLRS